MTLSPPLSTALLAHDCDQVSMSMCRSPDHTACIMARDALSVARLHGQLWLFAHEAFGFHEGVCADAGKRLGSSERSQLQSNSNWEASRFSVLESFIADYLAGGQSAGEGVRLKLQTPLFVSEALLDTAQKQLADLLATAEEVSVCLSYIVRGERVYTGNVALFTLPARVHYYDSWRVL